ncbi:MAG: VWA domain-containing protein [Kiritimatiellae bacterium]|nr:VWA domain-containing protein [Kiritimatiellia bacterium]MDD5520105.1 VWA domain-containing protein [Kiritimatiellia bacterium]
MFRFANPYYFFLLIPLGIAVWFVFQRRIKSGIIFAPISLIPTRGNSFRNYAAFFLSILFLSGLFFTILALARPQTVFSRIRNKTDAIAIEMVVDVSGTMEALDLSIRTATGTKFRTRLDAAKETFDQFTKKRPDDLIGLVTFGGYATTRAPLTADHSALLHVLKGVEVPRPSFDNQGQVVDQEELLTAIGDALATACARLEHADLKSKIIVLLSDGESNTGIIKPEDAIKVAKKMGIKIYTIGIGSTGSAPFLRKDMFGKDVIVHGEVALDEVLLGNIAKETGGRYFNVKDPSGLEKAMEEINKLERTKVERNIYEQYNELFPWFLWPALCLIITGTGLNMMISRRIV